MNRVYLKRIEGGAGEELKNSSDIHTNLSAIHPSSEKLILACNSGSNQHFCESRDSRQQRCPVKVIGRPSTWALARVHRALARLF